MEVKLLSGALGAEIKGIDLKDTSDQNFKKINDLLLEHKVIFFRNQNINTEEQIALAKCFGPLEKHIYVKGREKYPEIVRIIKGPNEKHQWGETWHTDVSYNEKPTKVIILKSLKIPPVGGDTMFSNMEIAWETLDENISESIIAESMTEDDIIELIKWEYTNICTDGGSGGGHPRGYGTYPRVLGKYVRENGWLSLEEAVYKMSGLAAKNMGLKGRGLSLIHI